MVGGQGDDTITGGTGTNIILGDSGQILAASSGAQFGTLPITVGLVETTAPGIGGVDHITTGTGGSIVFGGTAGDVIKTDQELDGSTSTSPDNTNFIFGDDGYITWVGTELDPGHLGAGLNPEGVFHGADTDSSDIDAVVSTDPADGGNDPITSVPARRSSSAARATTRSPAAPARTSSSATAARSSPPPAGAQFGTLPITVGLVADDRTGRRRRRPHHDRHRRLDRLRRHRAAT